MSRRPPLTLAGADVALSRRLPDGRAVVVYLDRDGKPLKHTREAQAFELRGVGWHLAEIKRAIAALPLRGAPIPTTEADAPRPRGFLFAHHTVATGDE